MSEPTETRPPLTVSYLVSESVNYPFRNWRFMLAKPVLWTIFYALCILALVILVFFLVGGVETLTRVTDYLERLDGENPEDAGDFLFYVGIFYAGFFLFVGAFYFFYYAKMYSLMFWHIGLSAECPPTFKPSTTEYRLWLAFLKLGIAVFGIMIPVWIFHIAVAGVTNSGFALFLTFLLSFAVLAFLTVRLITYYPRAAAGQGYSLRQAFAETEGCTGVVLGSALLLLLITFGIYIAASFVTMPFQIAVMAMFPTQTAETDAEALDQLGEVFSSTSFWFWAVIFGLLMGFIQTAVNVFAMAFGAKFMALVYDATAGAVPPEAPVAADIGDSAP